MGADVHRLAIAPAAAARPERRFRPGTFGAGDAGVLGLCALSAFAFTWLAFARIAPLHSGAELFLTWYLLFLASYWYVVSKLEGSVMAGDRAVGVVVASAAVAMTVPLALILIYVLPEGPRGPDLPLLHPDAGVRRPPVVGHDRRRRARHRRHARAGRPRGDDVGAPGAHVRGVPERDRWAAGTAGARVRGRHRAASPQSWPASSSTRSGCSGLRVLGIRRGARNLDLDAAHHHPHLRGGPAARPPGAAGGIAGARHERVADGVERRSADRPQRALSSRSSWEWPVRSARRRR